MTTPETFYDAPDPYEAGRQSGETTKNEQLQIRVDDLEKQGFVAAADVAGIPLSSWARERLRLAARRDLESAGLTIPFIAPLPPSSDRA